MSRNFNSTDTSDSAPQGQVTLNGDLLEIEFRYSPERVAAIKLIPQARFHADTKKWIVPLRQFRMLEECRLLGPTQLQYNFSPDLVSVTVEELTAGKAKAEELLHANPFGVPEGALQMLDLDAVVRLDPRGGGLRVSVRFRSKAQKIIEKIEGAHYIRPERSFFLPTIALPEFLKSVRDARLRFAVEAEAGRRLSSSAELRARIRTDPSDATGEELRTALLVPYIDLEGSDGEQSYFRLRGCTTQQLRECFPDAKSHSERRTAANAFGEEQLFRLLHRVPQLDFDVWLSADVQRFKTAAKKRLESSLEAGSVLSETLLSVMDVPSCWIAGSNTPAGILLDPELYSRVFHTTRGHPLSKRRRESIQQASKKFFFPVSEFEVLRVYEAVCSFLEEKGEAAFHETEEFCALLASVRSRAALLEQRRRFQSAEDAELAPDTFSAEDFSNRLFPHQRVAVSWLLETNRAFLGDDMGLGKTLSVLAVFDALRKRGDVDFLLVICPNSLLRNWIREAQQWLPSIRMILFPGERKERVLCLKQIGWGGLAVDGLVVNYEASRLDYVSPELEKLVEKRRVLICLDESQRVKNPGSKTFEALTRVVGKSARRVLLSGTPTPKDVSDIWAQMYLLDDGERFGKNYYTWLGKVAELGNRFSDYAVKRFKPEQVQETIARVHEVLLRRRKEEVVKLPEKTFLIRDIELSGDQLTRYEEVRKDLLLRMTSLNGKTFVREINNILEEYLRAVQMASNPRLIDESWKGDPAKFVELDTLVEELVEERDEKIVIWTNYLGNVDELVKRYAACKAAPFSGEVSLADRDKTLQEFQHGDCKILVAVPAAGGVGITLTAAQTAIYVDKTWNAEHWLQSIDRIHRIGQTGTVRIISLHASKVDELIAKNLARKSRDQARLLGDAEQADVGLPTREDLVNAVS